MSQPPPEFLPICSRCKKVRLPDGSWEIIESYITRRFGVTFTHTLCPDDLDVPGSSFPTP